MILKLFSKRSKNGCNDVIKIIKETSYNVRFPDLYVEELIDAYITAAKLLKWKVVNICYSSYYSNDHDFFSIVLSKDEKYINIDLRFENGNFNNLNGQWRCNGEVTTYYGDKIEDCIEELLKWL